jgi:hypothetical protein
MCAMMTTCWLCSSSAAAGAPSRNRITLDSVSASRYRTLRELAMSYFENYYNPDGEKTLRTYSRPVNLARFDRVDWMTAQETCG